MANTDREKPTYETVMDVTEEQVAGVYAKAFMGAAANLPNTTAVVEEVASIVDELLDRFPRLEQTLRSALVGAEDKAGMLDRLFKDRTSPIVLNFLKVLSGHGRLGILRSISRRLKRLDAERRGLTDVEVRVAKALDDDLRREIEVRVAKALGRQPVLHVFVDPSLIAGIMIRVGDRVYDGSVHTQLERARRLMIDRATERIESQPNRFMASSA
jgi:F-type H+-transporting ATPase subunit delta